MQGGGKTPPRTLGAGWEGLAVSVGILGLGCLVILQLEACRPLFFHYRAAFGFQTGGAGPEVSRVGDGLTVRYSRVWVS